MKKIIGIAALIFGVMFTTVGFYEILQGYLIGISGNSFEYILGTVLGAGFGFVVGILLILYGFKKVFEKSPKT